MSQSILREPEADYGLDAPGLVRNFLIGGAVGACAGIGLFIYSSARSTEPLSLILKLAGAVVAVTGIVFVAESFLMIWSSRYGKMRARDRLLDRLRLRGNETVLDVGCGRGLLLLGAAKRLPRGKALGVDLWSQEDLSSNSKRATLANAEAEGVAGRIGIYDSDMRKMPLANGSIDAVVASLSIHNIYSREGRREAIREIVRVLKPGGQVALMDFEHVKQYSQDLQECGMQNVQVSGISFWMFPPVRVVVGQKGH